MSTTHKWMFPHSDLDDKDTKLLDIGVLSEAIDALGVLSKPYKDEDIPRILDIIHNCNPLSITTITSLFFQRPTQRSPSK